MKQETIDALKRFSLEELEEEIKARKTPTATYGIDFGDFYGIYDLIIEAVDELNSEREIDPNFEQMVFKEIFEKIFSHGWRRWVSKRKENLFSINKERI